METQGSIGGLIPLWILGAPFLLAMFELFTSPKPRHRMRDDEAGGRQATPVRY